MDAYIEDKENREEDVDSWSVFVKRITTTHVVAVAWKNSAAIRRNWLSTFTSTSRSRGADFHRKSFQGVGVTLPVDGGKDHLLHIKDSNQKRLGELGQRPSSSPCTQRDLLRASYSW